MNCNYYAPKRLRVWGVSEHTPDINDLIISGSPVHKAYCKSKRCSGNSLSKGIEKSVKREIEMCPDCGYYLFWKTTTAPKKEEKENEKKNQPTRKLPEPEGRHVPL